MIEATTSEKFWLHESAPVNRGSALTGWQQDWRHAVCWHLATLRFVVSPTQEVLQGERYWQNHQVIISIRKQKIAFEFTCLHYEYIY